ncbi:hexameric tyrosine-coordinated heme protein [Tessaracoccus antarcticus]|uniref:hexameric tyrosine-coordinated heme protein n=1 Tax=Tessaracoccus antarcticus TaxID=2479848 RepID=UPI0018F59B30|nr:hexameric tyrosine-coordinated heme protein [Tessaracoccus antarcticus]
MITATAEEGRALAVLMARHSIHRIQPVLETLQDGRPIYAANADSLIAASQVIAIEFATIAAANNYWRP